MDSDEETLFVEIGDSEGFEKVYQYYFEQLTDATRHAIAGAWAREVNPKDKINYRPEGLKCKGLDSMSTTRETLPS